MPDSLPIDAIIVTDDRQRRANRDIDPQFVASVCRRLINPLTLRHGIDGPTLVAGERRLLALRAGGLTDLIHNTHYRFIEDLAPDEAEIIELEENVKRQDLYWRDQVVAIGRIWRLLKDRTGWLDERIATELNLGPFELSSALFVHRNLESPALRDASSIRQAYSILQNLAERRTVSIVQDIARAGSALFDGLFADDPNSNSPQAPADASLVGSPTPIPTDLDGQTPPLDSGLDRPPVDPPLVRDRLVDENGPVLVANFLDWAQSYQGDKFTLIHCDFPYDVEHRSYAKSLTSMGDDDYDPTGFWPLVDALCDNLDRLMSYSAHLMFWFSMDFYAETKARLEAAGLFVHAHPFVWLKTDNAGIIPGRDSIYPRRIYETALLATRGRRPLVKSLANAKGAPTASNAIHTSQKPIPVLKHFFEMLVDETTEVLDPTAGSGTALQVADEIGARRIVGLEINPDYARTANSAWRTAHALRRLSQ